MSDNKDKDSKIALLIISILIAAVVIGVLWFGAASGFKSKTAPVPATPSTVAVVTESVIITDVSPAAGSVVVENGTVKFFFPAGSATLPADAAVSLQPLIDSLKNGNAQAIITGFSKLSKETGDETGLVSLAKQRITAVRDFLLSLGISADILNIAAPDTDFIGFSSEGHAVALKLVGAPAVTTDDESRVVVEGDIVKFYFAVGKSDLPAQGVSEALLDVVAAVNSGKKAIISGFTDASGSAAVNEELSKQRAFTVRDALLALNVPKDSIQLMEPEKITGSGDAAQARRVEVRLTN